jgi:hypothetical protein
MDPADQPTILYKSPEGYRLVEAFNGEEGWVKADL